MNARDVARIAETLLRNHKIAAPAVPVEQIAKSEGLEIAYHDLEDNVSGLLIRREHGSPVIAVNVRHHKHRQRFTIAHELGHYLLHQDRPTVFVDQLLVHFRAERSASRADPREAEANTFAAALLMPEQLLQQALQDNPIDIGDEEAVRRFAQEFAVSPQALTIRLASLGLISAF